MKAIKICPYCLSMLKPRVIDMEVMNHTGKAMSDNEWEGYKNDWNAIKYHIVKRGLLVCDKCAFAVRVNDGELR